MASVILRKAATGDVKGIHGLLMSGADSGELLPRSLAQLYTHIRDFYVLEGENGHILGCCALSVMWEDVAEVRSLFVDTPLRGQGMGRTLVEAGMDELRRLGVRRVFTLTYQTDFFHALGFELTGKDTLPQKVWADCINCPKFPDCDEIAMDRMIG
jgi:N-acetylglutamate synthase and related acetyltransferases